MLRIVTRTALALAVAGVMVFGLGASGAGAQSADECVFDGDLESYLACVAGAGAENEGEGPDVIAANVDTSGSLARTGSDVGSLVGIGSALVILGGAMVYGVRQRRQHTSA
jgi:hypothetical protein